LPAGHAGNSRGTAGVKPEEGGEKQGNDDKMPEHMTEFVVRITKKGGKSGLLVVGSSLDTAFDINMVQFSEDVNDLHEKFTQQTNVDFYTGPAFDSLDERLRTEFNDFLTSLGVNEELMSFINIYANDKDQKLYLSWLKNVNKFI